MVMGAEAERQIRPDGGRYPHEAFDCHARRESTFEREITLWLMLLVPATRR